MESAIIKIGGMTCGGCVNSVRKVLTAINGVSKINVTLEAAQAAVEYDPAKATMKEFETAIIDAGFTVGD